MSRYKQIISICQLNFYGIKDFKQPQRSVKNSKCVFTSTTHTLKTAYVIQLKDKLESYALEGWCVVGEMDWLLSEPDSAPSTQRNSPVPTLTKNGFYKTMCQNHSSKLANCKRQMGACLFPR